MAMVIAFSSCSNLKDNKALREKKSKKASGDIIIGAVSSWALEKDENTWQALKMAVDEINYRDGIKGRKIQIVKEDDEGILDKGLLIAESFCNNPDMLAVIGHADAYITIPSSILYEFNGLILVSPTSDSQEISDQNSYKYIFQPSPNSDDYIAKLIPFLENSKINNVIVFNCDDVFGKRFGDYFEKLATRKGLNIVARIPYSEAASEIFFRNKLLACYYYYDFDAVLIAGYAPNAIPFLKYASMYKLNFQLLGTEQFDSKQLIAQVINTKKRVIFPSAFDALSEDKIVKNFIADFNKKIGVNPRSRAARWYNAMQFLAYAMLQAEALTPGKIIDSIHKIKNWHGVLGNIVFASQGVLKIIESNVVINTIKENGEIVKSDKLLPLKEVKKSNTDSGRSK